MGVGGRMLLLLLFLTAVVSVHAGLQCDFESTCPWNSSEPLNVVTGEDIQNLYKNTSLVISGPKMDFRNSSQSRFLYIQGDTKQSNSLFNLTSQWFNETAGICTVEFWLHTHHSSPDTVQVVVNTPNMTWHVKEKFNFKNMMWERHNITIGKITQPFRIIIEINKVSSKLPSHVAVDDIHLDNCYPEDKIRAECSSKDFKCKDQRCISHWYICDFHRDCPEGEDELEDCDKLPPASRCDFEDREMCGWMNDPKAKLQWLRRKGYSPPFGPETDHTFNNESGYYLFMESKASDLIHGIRLNSTVFNGTPIYHRLIDSPYYNICQIRFYYFMHGKAVGHLNLYAVEHKRRGGENNVHLWSMTRSQKKIWHQVAVPLPPIANKFHIVFEGTRVASTRLHIALDDISLSPECFGLGFKSPPNFTEPPPTFDPTDEPIEETLFYFPKYEFGSCNTIGAVGPSSVKCREAYDTTETRVTVMETGPFKGVQKWRVNSTNYYSVVARGASGGRKPQANGTSRGAVVRGIFQWNSGEEIFILVGQEGCSMGECGFSKPPRMPDSPRSRLSNNMDMIKRLNEGGGGGGGGTFIFKVDKSNQMTPLLIAAGGGGLARITLSNSTSPDGRSFNDSALPHNGYGHPVAGPGPGGGWNGSRDWPSGGQPLLKGGKGGDRCPNVSTAGMGGFGGGGGGCHGGGGGGGFAGGDAAFPDSEYSHGQGGVSFVSGEHPHWEVSSQMGAGTVFIYPAIRGCGCEDLCIVLDPSSGDYICKCIDGRVLRKDGKTCQEALVGLLTHHIVIIVLCTLVILGSVAGAMFFLYHRYRRQKRRAERQELYGNAELQLNRLRQQAGGMVTEYNPNYEFGGSTCTLQDLKEVPRENLTLVKALGQGAFGEVYQGYLSNVSGWHRDIPVAVKTLPELASNQSEMDFLMEAMIMSKFNHPNIVHFIGVCFEKPPKFLVLELLPGGDLKSFLRESRPKPDRPSPLTMSDLLMLAMDVAKGCQYLEENHFIHRDIAARNCLLSSKGPGRVVKIADFGMARDIYRSDYYRKGGKAMLPVKWMPPEAFLDGIFTSKTDVWSFGVLLWEVMSLGYMPYPGRGNQDVMQLVTSGGRLESPSNCPSPVYHIMTQCWHAVPDERPNFQTIIERLGYCMQDPDVIQASLPIFHRPPSTERDATVMRPPDSENTCLQVQRPGTEPVSPASTEYLIPIPSSNYSLSTERTELQSGSSGESIDKLLELDEKNGPTANATAAAAAPVAGSKQWETSFAKPTDNSPCPPKKRAGGYTSVPTQEEATPQPNAVGRSPPPNIARQRPSAKKPIQSLMALQEGGATSASPSRSSISLDAAALARQHPQQYPYMNVDVSPTPLRSDKTQDNSTYIIGNHYDKEINC